MAGGAGGPPTDPLPSRGHSHVSSRGAPWASASGTMLQPPPGPPQWRAPSRPPEVSPKERCAPGGGGCCARCRLLGNSSSCFHLPGAVLSRQAAVVSATRERVLHPTAAPRPRETPAAWPWVSPGGVALQRHTFWPGGLEPNPEQTGTVNVFTYLTWLGFFFFPRQKSHLTSYRVEQGSLTALCPKSFSEAPGPGLPGQRHTSGWLWSGREEPWVACPPGEGPHEAASCWACGPQPPAAGRGARRVGPRLNSLPSLLHHAPRQQLLRPPLDKHASHEVTYATLPEPGAPGGAGHFPAEAL